MIYPFLFWEVSENKYLKIKLGYNLIDISTYLFHSSFLVPIYLPLTPYLLLLFYLTPHSYILISQMAIK
jgi:hypothetical protein